MDVIDFSRWLVAVGYLGVVIVTLIGLARLKARPSRIPLYLFGAFAAAYWTVYYFWLALNNPLASRLAILLFHAGHFFIIAHALTVAWIVSRERLVAQARSEQWGSTLHSSLSLARSSQLSEGHGSPLPAHGSDTPRTATQ